MLDDMNMGAHLTVLPAFPGALPTQEIGEHLVRTDPKEGLTAASVHEALAILGQGVC